MRHLLSILFGAALTAAASWSIGRLLFTRLRIELRRLEYELLAGIAGAALLSFLIFFLCAAHLAYVPAFWAIGLVTLALNWKYAAAPARDEPGRLPALQRWIFTVPLVLFTLLYLANSLAPEHSPDGQAYHLGNVYRFFRQHGFERITTNMYASLSQGAEMLYLFAFSIGRHAAAATFHCCFLFALPLLIFAYGRRIEKPAMGACAALLFFFSPIAAVDGVSAYNDIALAACGFAVFYLLEIWRETRRLALIVPIGLIAGFCFAIKYTGFAAGLYVLAMLAWEYLRGRGRETAIAFAIAASLMLLMAAPWLIRNWLWLHNPVAPFFNRVFPNPWTHISFEDDYRHHYQSYNLPNLKPLFWGVTVSGRFDGVLGPVFLLTPLALLGLRSREGRRILLAGAFFLLPYPANIGARFLLPALPFAALGIALAFEFAPRIRTALVVVAALLAWPGVTERYTVSSNWQITGMPWKAALGIVSQDDFLAKNSEGWIVARMVDQYVPDGKRVWSTDAVAEAYSKTKVLVNYYSAEGERIQDILYSPNEGNSPTQELRYTFPSRELSRLTVVQTAGGSSEMWSIAEMRFFHGHDEIGPEKSWRYSASSFPWDIGFAFDRNPATRWRSWDAMHPGMSMDVSFGHPVLVDRVELLGPHNEPHAEVRIDGIDARLEKLDVAEPPNYRRLVTATVKAMGIDYLLTGGDGWLANETHSDPARWGLRKLAERGKSWLFEIQ
ncbi:MAG TPA: glycosyltransferase family 39 protein [Bryobacteraceae bacterium]|nr:glycosyltransferase family 39 protein [Bryobacteraceae bacterium]